MSEYYRDEVGNPRPTEEIGNFGFHLNTAFNMKPNKTQDTPGTFGWNYGISELQQLHWITASASTILVWFL